MYGEIGYDEIENGFLQGSTILVDVRTKKEFNDFTIPGAINIPIMNEKEREEIGTVFVQEDVKKAKRMGIDVGSRKLPEIYRIMEKLYDEYDNVVVFCARGGYRSKSIFYIMRAMGFNIYKLKGGYKEYRNHINKNLPILVNNANFVVLSGKTGCGKTKILKELDILGKNTLDLEEFANHRGSLLGGIGLGEQNSQKMFESLVYHALKGKDNQLFFVEGESKRIGRIIMQGYLYDKIKNSITVKVDSPLEYRIDTIYEDYVNNNKEEIIEKLDQLSGYISKIKIQDMKQKIQIGEYKNVIEELMNDYYDLNYDISKNCSYEIINSDEKQSARRLIEIFDC